MNNDSTLYYFKLVVHVDLSESKILSKNPGELCAIQRVSERIGGGPLLEGALERQQ